MSMRRHLLLSALLVLAGCASTIGPPDGSMDRSREVAKLKAENRVLRSRLADLEAAHAAEPGTLPVEPTSPQLPRPTDLSITNGSSIRGGVTPTATIRFSTVDAHGRFVQVTGPLTIVLAAIMENGEAIRIAHAQVDPARLRASLRAGFMGTAYALPVDLEEGAELPPIGGNVLVRVTLEDIRLEMPLTAEQLVPVLPPQLSSGSTK